MASTGYVLQNLEKTIRKESKLYQAALQKDLRYALRERHWDATIFQIGSLRSTHPEDPLQDSFFQVKDKYVPQIVGYIFPLRRTAITDRTLFVDAFTEVLSPQGYEVLRYAHHRGLPDVQDLINLLRQNNSQHFQVERSSEQLSA